MTVLSAYGAQVQQLKGRLAHFHSLHKITTIYAAQGTEDDYVIVSLVRSNKHSALGFVGDPKRANVAITRSRYGTILSALRLSFSTLR